MGWAQRRMQAPWPCETLAAFDAQELCDRAKTVLIDESNVQPVRCPVTVSRACDQLVQIRSLLTGWAGGPCDAGGVQRAQPPFQPDLQL